MIISPDIYFNYGDSSKKDSPLLIAMKALELINTEYVNYLHVYTDGSVQDNGNVGAAFVIPTLNIEKRFTLPRGVSIFSAELIAILMALNYFDNFASLPVAIAIFTDSKSALSAIKSGESRIREEIQLEIKIKSHQLITRGTAVSLVWVPGHTSLRGNERADYNAKMASKGIDSISLQIGFSVSEIYSVFKKIAWKVWQENFKEEAKSKNWLFHSLLTKKEIQVPGGKYSQSIVHRLRVGAWRTRFLNPPLKCLCGQTLSPNHLFIDCSFNDNPFAHFRNNLQEKGLPVNFFSMLIPSHEYGWKFVNEFVNVIFKHPLGHCF